ncbi:hypothetical protein C6497_03325 [Candidatus Poribacteria bacterium]|nr:MAG: hypothetical protein C6497_03325 [Candidatus Poribacteria bacterium]
MAVEYTKTIVEVINKLEIGNPVPTLVPKNAWNDDLTNTLEGLSLGDLFQGHEVKDDTYAQAIKSGLLLWNDALDESHEISQTLANETGSYWHGLMHRREPDYSNSKYWFGRVGDHPIFPSLRDNVLSLSKEIENPSDSLSQVIHTIESEDKWNSFQFVDWCESAENDPTSDSTAFLKQIQAEEIKLLLAYSYQNAV